MALVVALTANTRLEPQRYERQLLYRSRSTNQPTPAERQTLLGWSRAYNAAHGITGLLLYSKGRYVQVLESSEVEVEYLYAAIQRDARHTHVVTVSRGSGPRRFATWNMDFGYVTAKELRLTLDAVQGPTTAPSITDPHLQALLQAFT